MRVALLSDSIESGSPGFRQYVTGLIGGLEALGSRDITLVHRGPDPFYTGRDHEYAPAAGGPRFFRELRRRQWVLPQHLEASGFDVVHDTYHFGPFLRPSRFARVLTIGDLTPLVTRTHSAKQRWAHRLLAPVIAHRAHQIVTFSENSKRDIVRLFRVPADHVTVALLAASDRFGPMANGEVEAARARLGLPARYVLHVGTLEPRKNITTLVRAFASALPDLGDTELLLVGRQGWRMESLPALIEQLGLRDRIIIRGDITADDLPAVYGGALTLAYPSLYEGFGLPPLEAMQCGAPVITSNASSLPEVVGDAALTVAPSSVDDLARALAVVASDASLRDSLRERGLRRAATFSWRRTAELTRLAYERALATSHRGGTVAAAEQVVAP
jgi:glycosyltransferase involved in cell wall biosynthesis